MQCLMSHHVMLVDNAKGNVMMNVSLKKVSNIKTYELFFIVAF